MNIYLYGWIDLSGRTLFLLANGCWLPMNEMDGWIEVEVWTEKSLQSFH